MLLRKSVLLASIAALSVSVAGAQQLGNGNMASATGFDPLAAPVASNAPLRADALDLVAPPARTSSSASAPALSLSAADALGAPAPQPSPVHFAVPIAAPSPAAAAPAPFVVPAAAIAPVQPASPAANPFVQARPVVAPPVAAPEAGAFALDAPDAAAAAASEPAAGGPDDRALRYYASEKNLARVGAEIRRLKAIYPGWQPPSDLFAPKSTVDEQPLWDLFGKGDYAGTRRQIDALKESKPGWQPSADLLQKLGDGETRKTISDAAARANWPALLTAAQGRPGLLVCENMDVLWNVGEAFARTGNLARAFDLYGYALQNCNDPAERLATFQKASALLPAQGVEALLTYGRALPTGQGEFDSQRFDGLRKAIGDVASGASSITPPVEQLQAFAAYVGNARSAADMGLIGWYFYGQQDWARSADWFRAGVDAGGDAKVMEGYILALRNADRLADAEAAAYTSYRQSPELSKIYVEMVSEQLSTEDDDKPVGPDVLKRFSPIVMELRSPLGAQAIGWHLVHDEAYDEAETWFQRSVDWKPTEEGVVGLAVVASRLKQTADVKAIRAKYGEEFPTLTEFKDEEPTQAARRSGTRQASQTTTKKQTGGRSVRRGGDSLMAEANKKFQAGDYEGALASLDRREGKRGKEYGAEILRGWANYKLKRWEKARDVFTAQDRIRSTKDTRVGIGVTANSRYRMWSETENKCKTWGKC